MEGGGELLASLHPAIDGHAAGPRTLRRRR
jgi:hypothetical protein